MVAAVSDKGWLRLGPDPRLAAWAAAALPIARAAVAQSREEWRCGGTWFVGVDALPNDVQGGVGGTPLPWQALPLMPEPLHRAQISVIRPGYPQPSAAESAPAYGYRLNRDAAHLDGLLPIGPDKRRMLREPHGWILGLPLNECSAGAAPLVVWEGSHEVMRQAMQAALAGHQGSDWAGVDVTDAYRDARNMVFKTCRRVELPAHPGEATLLHRLCLHGVARWQDGATAPDEGRMIAYFRPQLAQIGDWLTLP